MSGQLPIDEFSPAAGDSSLVSTTSSDFEISAGSRSGRFAFAKPDDVVASILSFRTCGHRCRPCIRRGASKER